VLLAALLITGVLIYFDVPIPLALTIGVGLVLAFS
jgi:hypothetical protein